MDMVATIDREWGSWSSPSSSSAAASASGSWSGRSSRWRRCSRRYPSRGSRGPSAVSSSSSPSSSPTASGPPPKPHSSSLVPISSPPASSPRSPASSPTTCSSKAGLQFPVGRIVRYLKAGKYAELDADFLVSTSPSPAPILSLLPCLIPFFGLDLNWQVTSMDDIDNEEEDNQDLRPTASHFNADRILACSTGSVRCSGRPPLSARRRRVRRLFFRRGCSGACGGRGRGRSMAGKGKAEEGDQVGGLVSAGWTNDTHNMYISSMEASFMQQLRGQQQHHHHATPDRSMIHVGSGHGLKVLQEGASDNLGSKKNVPRPRDVGPRGLPEDPWARCFKPRDSAMNRRGDGVGASGGESGTDTVQAMAPKHGRGFWQKFRTVMQSWLLV
ncbi:hypothetical protein TRIUR3_00911 [Triticum urartu]|uniref:Uncharacterized protein n=1 Tax=Triticum urartu TaxID=4572 RepID=M8AGA7_TRIUA|nr:hypothetical protein TRIUR3_00911 [Triticum urartu]